MIGRDLPAQIHHVADAGVHPEPAQRREQMCRVAGEKHRPCLVMLRHQREPAGPGTARDDVERHVGAQQRPDRRLGVDRAPVGAFRHLVMDDPGLAPVLRIHHRPHLRVDDPGHVGGRPAARRHQGRGADIARQHGAAHEGAVRGAVVAHHAEAERLAHRAAGAVDAEQVARADALPLAGGDVLDLGRDAVGARHEGLQAPAEIDVGAGRALGAAPERALEHDLRDGVGKLGRRPVRIGAGLAAEFMAAEARHIGARPREARRQSLRAQLSGNPEAAEMLHRARIGVVAFRMLGGVKIFRHQHGRHATPVELDCRRQPDRPAADDQSKGFSLHRSFHTKIHHSSLSAQAGNPVLRAWIVRFRGR